MPEWRKQGDGIYRCTFGNYDEDVTSKNTITKRKNGKEFYITYANFSAFNKKRRQGDLCFVDNDLIYTISI